MSERTVENLFDYLPNEIFLKIINLLDIPSFYCLHSVCLNLFHRLAEINFSRSKLARKKARNLVLNFVERYIDDETNAPYDDSLKRNLCYNEYCNLVRGTPHENVVIEVTRLFQEEIERLVSHYRSFFRYNLIYQPNRFFSRVSSVVLSYNFLEPFYEKKNAD